MAETETAGADVTYDNGSPVPPTVRIVAETTTAVRVTNDFFPAAGSPGSSGANTPTTGPQPAPPAQPTVGKPRFTG